MSVQRFRPLETLKVADCLHGVCWCPHVTCWEMSISIIIDCCAGFCCQQLSAGRFEGCFAFAQEGFRLRRKVLASQCVQSSSATPLLAVHEAWRHCQKPSERCTSGAISVAQARRA